MVELNFGENVAAPKGEFDLQSYASFDQVMQAIQNKIPLSKEALYTRYKLPRPKNSDDEFILENESPQLALSDSLKKKEQNRKAVRIF